VMPTHYVRTLLVATHAVVQLGSLEMVRHVQTQTNVRQEPLVVPLVNVQTRRVATHAFAQMDTRVQSPGMEPVMM
jgi:hypothetical protein